MFWAGLIVLSWAATELSGYITHRFMHWLDIKAHDYHHELYPPDDYIDRDYREPPSSLLGQGKFYAIPSIVYLVWVYLLWGWLALAAAVCVVAVTAKWTQYVHDAIHIYGHWLERFDWFWCLRLEHWVHHDADKNYGISTLMWDKVFRSYVDLSSDTKSLLIMKWNYSVQSDLKP